MWPLSFISENDFYSHVKNTIKIYGENLKPYNLEKFNSNIIDPIKLIFDKSVFGFSWEEIIRNEIFRQRDKSTNNEIGYFHQRIFNHIQDCDVPDSGWDVIVTRNNINVSDRDTVSRVFVEMKNKHNTMNSSASSKTYIRMQAQLLDDDDCVCMLVEAIAKKSQNIAWAVSVDGEQQKYRRIRRVSIDKFYELVTGKDDAFYKICMQLPKTIEKVVSETTEYAIPCDTVFNELEVLANSKGGSIALALYILGFNDYIGF